MATTEVTITGDLSDVVDQDFTRAQYRVRSNTPGFLSDIDADKIRILDEQWQTVADDGTFTVANLIASTDTVVAGTLQYYFDLRVWLQREWKTVTLGPYVLDGDADLSDLEAQQPTQLTRAIPPDIDSDILGTAEAYTDDVMDAHVSAVDPHPQYALVVDGNGDVVPSARVLLIGAGGQFPDSRQHVGDILIYGGN